MWLKLLLTIIVITLMLGALTGTLMNMWGIFSLELCYKLVSIELLALFVIVTILMMFY
jgi:hypothetical protein